MPTQTPVTSDDWSQGDDHDALRALIAEGLAADAGDPGDW